MRVCFTIKEKGKNKGKGGGGVYLPFPMFYNAQTCVLTHASAAPRKNYINPPLLSSILIDWCNSILHNLNVNYKNTNKISLKSENNYIL